MMLFENLLWELNGRLFENLLWELNGRPQGLPYYTTPVRAKHAEYSRVALVGVRWFFNSFIICLKSIIASLRKII